MSVVRLPIGPVLQGPVTVLPPINPSSSVATVTVTQPNITSAIGVLIKGATGILGELIEANDVATNPIWGVGDAGGAGSSFGDPIKAYPPGDVFNPAFRTMNDVTTTNVSTNAGGIQLGHGSGIIQFFLGVGLPSAIYPVTTGMPPNGSIFFRLDGALGATMYQARAGVWVDTGV